MLPLLMNLWQKISLVLTWIFYVILNLANMMIFQSVCDPFDDHCCPGFYSPPKSRREGITWITMDRLPKLLSFARVVQGLFVAMVVGLTGHHKAPPSSHDESAPGSSCSSPCRQLVTCLCTSQLIYMYNAWIYVWLNEFVMWGIVHDA